MLVIPMPEPQVDPVTGQIERLSSSARDALPTPRDLSPSERAAATRLADVVRRSPPRTRGGRETGHVSLAALGPSRLRTWFDDVDAFAGRRRGDAWTRDMAKATTSPRPPTADQSAVLEALGASTLGPTRMRWHTRNGVPSWIDGPIALQRGRAPEIVAAGYVAANQEMLRRLARADGRDVLEPVAQREDDEDDLESIVFARYRDGLRVEANHVEVFVTRASHAWGGGVVARLRLQWDEVESASGPFISEERAREIVRPRTPICVSEAGIPVRLRPQRAQPLSTHVDGALRSADRPWC